jgi:hypothetical protein
VVELELLASGFFLMAHDWLAPKCRLEDRKVGIGLAGGLLGEQLLFQRINVRGGELRVINAERPQNPHWDELAGTVLEYLCAEPDLTSIRTWLDVLGQDAYDQVGSRLVRDGILDSYTGRRMLRTTTIYAPVTEANGTHSLRPNAPEARLTHALIHKIKLRAPDVMLGGLVLATDLDVDVLADMPVDKPTLRQYLRNHIEQLPSSGRDLIRHIEAAVGDMVLSPRN